MRSQSLLFLLFALAVSTVECINSEGDALFEWKIALTDPNNVLQSWDPTLPNPCTWFHVSCNSQNSVTRLDLGNARLSGTLVPQLGLLTNLQYLAAFSNNISGPIPMELGNLTKLLSLELNDNQLTGSIPSTLANLKYLRFLRLNGNRLTGKIPSELVGLLYYGNLSIMNVSDNYLAGTVRATNPTMFAVTTIVQDPRP